MKVCIHIFLRCLCFLFFIGNIIPSFAQSDSIIINNYTEVLSFEICTNKLIVANAAEFKAGDTVLIMQMKGAVIDSSHTIAFGTITGYKNAGNYEFNYVRSKSGNTLELLNVLERQYDLPHGKVQLIRVPYFQNYTLATTLTCLPWDGSKGGVTAFNVQNTLHLNADIDVSGKGFKGGAIVFNPDYLCDVDSFYVLDNTGIIGSLKGEGIYTTDKLIRGRGKLANGGGGGNSTNSGGAGGSNTGHGGEGGRQYVGVCSNGFPNGGIGGEGLDYSNASNRVFLGGGGGAGHQNNQIMAPGGNGGGVVIINAGTIVPGTFSIKANGESPVHVDAAIDDGRSGAGAGGVIVLNYGTVSGNITLSAKGGKGDDCLSPNYQQPHGPGGGGGGGTVWVNKPVIESNLLVDISGGQAGTNLASGDTWGATSGENGAALTSLNLPVADVLFRPNIDSVRIRYTLTGCAAFNFEGAGYVHTYPVASWQWDLGDSSTAFTQNTTHAYPRLGDFTVKLIVTDINGCKDSITANVHAEPLTVTASNDVIICRNTSVQLSAISNFATQYRWSPAHTLTDSTVSNPVASPSAETLYRVRASNGICNAEDSVRISFHPLPVFTINPPVKICPGDSVELTASGGVAYSWYPPVGLTNAGINNPTAFPDATTNYTVMITEPVCNERATLSTSVTLLPLPKVRADKSNDIDCSHNSSQLTATGASYYTWSPAATLSNPAIPNPVATPVAETEYIVMGTDAAGCVNYDSVIVKAGEMNETEYLVPNAFTPNHDGLNDCFGISHWGLVYEIEFSIFNRAGQLLFRTTDPNGCWDGTYKAVMQGSEVFVYMVRGKTKCESQVFRKGTFTLIR